jgi:hypothetical protein
MGAAVAQEISPELVLVCPELREHALELLPPVDPDKLFAVEPRPAAPKPAPPPPRPRLVLAEPERRVTAEPERRVTAEPERRVTAEPERRAPLPVALAVYTTEALLLGAVRGAALTAAIAIVAFFLAR